MARGGHIRTVRTAKGGEGRNDDGKNHGSGGQDDDGVGKAMAAGRREPTVRNFEEESRPPPRTRGRGTLHAWGEPRGGQLGGRHAAGGGEAPHTL